MQRQKATQMKYIGILLISIIFSVNGIAQKKTTEHRIKEITGTATGNESQTPEQIKQKAINNAKVAALKKAGIAEHINSYTDYFRSETEDKMEELFTSDILSTINGTVKDIDILDTQLGVNKDNQITYTVKISCTVVKYKTTSDKSFSAWIDGVQPGYKVGEGLKFKVKPTKDCYIRAFVFTEKSYILLPNDWEQSKLLSAQTNYEYPDKNIVESYLLTIEDENKDRETNRLVILLLKEDLYYTGKVNYKAITDWIMSIPPDERLIESFAFEVYREK